MTLPALTPAMRKAKPYFFFLATLRVFLAVFFTADLTFLVFAVFAFFAFFAFLAMLPSINEMACDRCALGNRNALVLDLHQRAKKNSVPLKEVLTPRA